MEGLVGLRLIVFQEEKSSGAKASRSVNRKIQVDKKEDNSLCYAKWRSSFLYCLSMDG